MGEKTTKIKNKSVKDFDGAYQVIHTATWGITRIPDVGNNPRNAWPGHTPTRDIAISTNWHDNRLSLMDANAKTLISQFRSGATNAHVMVAPGADNRDDRFVSHMGAATAAVSAELLEAGHDPNIGLLRGRLNRMVSGSVMTSITLSSPIPSTTQPPCTMSASAPWTP
ncbi:MAG: hypothetical protein M5R38_13725 [Candidatus Methylomirabilis sp.]|nr:hypothetical protein [Candidatus Methylomirabilis sp.]